MTHGGHGEQRRYNVLGQDLGGYKPPRDRMVAVRSVACPSCGALAGEPCRSATGATLQHLVRRRMALRAERNES